MIVQSLLEQGVIQKVVMHHVQFKLDSLYEYLYIQHRVLCFDYQVICIF